MAAVTPSDLTGLFKEVYGDSVINLIPGSAKFTKMVPFVQREKELGNLYHQPVVVTYSHGVTYAAANAGAFSLNSTVAMSMQDAQVNAPQILLREALAYDAAAKASRGPKAFVAATELLVETMMESTMKRVELATWYGGVGLGQVASGGLSNTNATTEVATISLATWAAGIWAGMKNAKINFYDSNGTLISSGDDSVFTISSVNVANRTLTVTGTSTGITALDGASNFPLDIYFNGANGAEMSGIDTILTNTGTLFNISATTYELWKGNSYSAGSAALTFGKVLAAIADAVNLGLDEKVCLWVNPSTWANLNSDLAALRRLDGSYKKSRGENGQEEIVYYGQNGEIEVKSHNCIKKGEAFILPMKKCKRLGAQDVSFKTPGREDEIFLHLPDNAGFELRTYTDQQVFIETPARCVKVTNIVNA